MRCLRCQHENRPQAKFCEECASPLDGATRTAPSYADLKAEVESLRPTLGEALEQQTATSEILRVISGSPADVQPVFDAVAESAARLCDAFDVTIFRRDGDRLRLVAHYGPIPVGAGDFSLPVTRETVGGRSVIDAVTLNVEDVQADANEFPEGVAFARRFGHRAMLSVPLSRDGAAIGVIQLRRTEPGRFSDQQVALLQTFADQAVIAIGNVRLFTELEARNTELTETLEQQTATSEILRVIASSPTDAQPVFDTIAASAARLCDGLDVIVLRVYDDVLRLVAHYGSMPAGDVPLHRGTLGGRTVIERRVIHIDDLGAAIEEYPEGSAMARARGHRTTLSVPLLKEDVAIGNIQIRRNEIRPFSDQQVSLLKTFADQAVIAIENVRLFTELQEKNRALTEAHAQVTETLEQQTATAEILGVISRSPTDVQPVFDTIIRSAVVLCGAMYGSAVRFDGELMHLVAGYNYTPEVARLLHEAFPMRPSPRMMAGRAILSRDVVQVEDALEDSDYAEGVARAGGFRSMLAAPMLRDGRPIGAIVVNRGQPGSFSRSQIELLKTFADQAVIAIENVRLFKELQARTGELTQSVEQLTALGEVSRAVSSTLDVEMVLDTIVSHASQLAGAAGCSIYEYDEAAERFELRAMHNYDAEFAEALRAVPLRKGEGLMGRAAEMREPVQIPDITQPGAYQSSVRDTLMRFGYRALLSVPLLRKDQIIGSLSFNRKAPGEFPPEVVDVLKTFATQSALAIQNARLFREIGDKSRQLEAASRHKSEFLANMSYELRTPLNAVIGFSEVLLQRMFGALNDKQDEYLKDIYASGQHLLSLINDILDLSKIEAGRMELVPAPFHLPTALENAVTLVRERAARHGIALHLDLDPRLDQLVGDERKVKQVVLNLLSNAVKFTPEGGHISLKASRRDGAIEVAVTDTGIGIAPEDQAAIFEEFRQVGSDETRKQEGTGLGLTLAKKFVELHGGRIWVESKLGSGSTFTFTLPVS